MEGKLVEWPVIGIDLGTTYSCVGVWQHDHVDIITNDQGNRTTPSWVAFTELERLVGDAAKNQISANPTNTIYDVKRLIGRRITDEIVQNDMKLWPFSVRPGTDDIPMIEVSYKGEVKQFAPEQISAMVLTKMKETAEAYLGSEVKNAVVTIPAYFSDCQRQATKDAGVIAGLNVVSMINEPTAAAIAYGIHKTAGDCYVNTRNVLVFDLGGGTFDVSVVSVDDDSFQVNSISGDTHLGGADFDNKLVNHFVAEFRRKHKKDIGSNPRALARLRASSERAKRSLSSATESSFELDCLFEEIDFSCTISRARFEMLNAELFLSCMKPVENCLLDAKMDKSDIDDVILVGGSTRIPKVQELLQKFFSGNELCKRLNPDEAVAYGAAIHAAILSGVLDKQQFLLVEVTPLSLGIGVRNIDFAVVMPKNTSIPRKIEQRFTTVYDNQTEVAINVYEGERPIAKDNNFLGKFCLYDIPSAPKNVPDIMVSFSIDGNGILTVTAEEKSSGNKDQVTITKHTGRLSEGEIARMVKDAKEYQREDTELKKVEKSKELFEHYVNDRQDFLREHGWKMEAEDMEVIKVAVERAIQWLDKNSHIKDAAKFDRKLDKLRSICQPLMGKMYRKDN